MQPPLCFSLISNSKSVRSALGNKGEAKNPCLKIPDSICSPHIYIKTKLKAFNIFIKLHLTSK